MTVDEMHILNTKLYGRKFPRAAIQWAMVAPSTVSRTMLRAAVKRSKTPVAMRPPHARIESYRNRTASPPICEAGEARSLDTLAPGADTAGHQPEEERLQDITIIK